VLRKHLAIETTLPVIAFYTSAFLPLRGRLPVACG
jgi:hypothetical protein